MPVKNIVSIGTNSGYKNIEIHHDDLSRLNWPVDVLVISAFRGSYEPTPGTLIEALEKNAQIKVMDLFQTKRFDFRDTLNAWVSERIENKNFKYIICLEGMSDSFNSTGMIEPHLEDLLAVLSVLQHKGLNIKSIAVPLLGTGQQRIAVNELVPLLIKKSKELLETIQLVQTIYFVHPRIENVELVNDEINRLLQRGPDKLELIRQDTEIAAILDRISNKLLSLKTSFGWGKMRGLDELSYRITKPDIRFYELGILSRRAMESILKSLLASNRQMTLNEMVNELHRFKLSSWMLTYMHTVRSFGNFLAHDSGENQRKGQLSREDILFFAHALDRFLDIIQQHCHSED
jgi:hypothetical protein